MQGKPTELLRSSLETAREHSRGRARARDDDWTRLFPSCNTEWSQAKGSRVWCDGGKFPRLTTLTLNGKEEERCICESHTGYNEDTRRLYPGCAADASSCSFTKLRKTGSG